jgi:hypothetical protein
MTDRTPSSPLQRLFNGALLVCASVVLLWISAQVLAQVWGVLLTLALLAILILVVRAIVIARRSRW